MGPGMILVPFKNLRKAKQRLAGVLDAGQRAALAAAMLEDVLNTLAAWPARLPVAVVTGDPWAIETARGFGFDVIRDEVDGGETNAIEMATRFCEASGTAWTLVLPADIPLMEAEELSAILAAAPAEGSVLVPAGDGRGTNAALRRPAALFPLRFGDDSFLPHRSVAQATGKPCVVLRLAGIGLDIDRPADLAAVLERPDRTRTQDLLRGWSLSERFAVAQSR